MRTVIFAYNLYREYHEALLSYEKQQSLDCMRSYKMNSERLCDDIDGSLT